MRPKSEIFEAAKLTLKSSSIIAIPNMFRTKFQLIKLIWLVCLLGMTALCGWFIADILTKFFKCEVVSRINHVQEHILPFPIVYICDNFNPKYTLNINDRIISAEFDSKVLDISQEFEKVTTGTSNCIRFNSNPNKTFYFIQKPILAFLELELFIGSALAINETKFNGLYFRIADQTHSATSRIENIYISPGTFSKIYIYKTLIKKQPYPYSECIDNLNSPVNMTL
jgi:hypothetical protein